MGFTIILRIGGFPNAPSLDGSVRQLCIESVSRIIRAQVARKQGVLGGHAGGHGSGGPFDHPVDQILVVAGCEVVILPGWNRRSGISERMISTLQIRCKALGPVTERMENAGGPIAG